MKKFLLLSVLATLIFGSCSTPEKNTSEEKKTVVQEKKASGKDEIIARRFDTGFKYSRGNYNGISGASDGNIYYVLCSGELDMGGQLYRYLPATDKIEHLGDLTEACGEKGMKAIPQGKSHVLFVELNKELYFATHIDYYEKYNPNKKEVIASAPKGYKTYPGGHFVSYNTQTKKFTDYGIGVEGDGILTFAMDTIRKRMYGITWPHGYVVSYDIASKKKKIYGQYFDKGEVGEGASFQILTRTMVVDHSDGSAYFCDQRGNIFQYKYDKDTIEIVSTDSLKRDYFGCAGLDTWRQAIWSNTDKKLYGGLFNSEYLSTYDPKTGKIELLDRLSTDDALKNGKLAGFGCSLGMMMGNDGKTIYRFSVNSDKRIDVFFYCNGVLDVYKNHHYCDFHLTSYNIETRQRQDHGKIRFSDNVVPQMINSMAIGKDGTFYALAYFNLTDSLTSSDLISFKLK